jgi:dihydroorotate dehydrogenase (NAD+) catalytic subunit
MIVNASGCLDALEAPEVARSLDAFVTKTVTPQPRQGNRPVRFAETEHGMLNSIGLENPGIEALLAEKLPQLAELGVPIWVSVGGFAARDYAELCAALDGRDEVATIELNLSCPNVDEAPESAAEIVAAARVETQKSLYAKLSPAAPDVGEVALAVQAAGADGLSLVNTMRGLALDAHSLEPILGTETGGYSGPALKPIALAAVFRCYRATGLPIVGMGGIFTGRDAFEFIAAGASAVALGTVLFADPDAPARVRAELAAELSAQGLEQPEDARGIAHRATGPLLPDQKKPGLAPKTEPLQGTLRVTSISRRGGNEDSSAGARAIPRPTDGGAEEGERHPRQAGATEEGPENGSRQDRKDPDQSPRVRRDREGLRHADGGPQVRAGQGGAIPEPGQDQPVEDGRRALGPPAL